LMPSRRYISNANFIGNRLVDTFRVEEDKDEILYERHLIKLAREKSPIPFGNSSAMHAVKVFSLLFQYAENEINLLAGDLNGAISAQPQYQIELNGYLASKENGKLNILLQRYQEEKKPPIFELLSFYQNRYPGKVNIKLINDSCDSGETMQHFCTVDNMYRYETDPINYKAVCCFNDTLNLVSNLNERFKNCWEKSDRNILA